MAISSAGRPSWRGPNATSSRTVALRAQPYRFEALLAAEAGIEVVARVTRGDQVLRAAQAILSVLPLDSFIPHPLLRMEVEDDPVKTTPVQDELLALAGGSGA